jgi:hypothetical protein
MRRIVTIPERADTSFLTLACALKDHHGPIPFEVREIVLAQAALESGWGRSELAKRFNNFSGMKWRAQMYPYGLPVTYTDWQNITEPYCFFPSVDKYLEAYWVRFEVIPAYKGNDAVLREKGPDGWLEFIGPIWLGMGAQKGKDYIKTVQEIRGRIFGP